MVSYSFEGNKRLWNVRDEEENEKIFGTQSKPTGVKIPDEIKPTYLVNPEFYVEKWPLSQLMRLLRLYGAHRCLWDVTCKDNRNRKMRHAALVDVTAALDNGMSKEQVAQKFNILRATYRYEKKRIKQRIRRGLGARTKLKWFALADAFLRKVPKKGQKEEDPSNSDSDLEDTIVFTINPESLVPLDQDYSEENSLDFKDNEDNLFQNKATIYTDDDTQSTIAAWEPEEANESSNDEDVETNSPFKAIKTELKGKSKEAKQECKTEQERKPLQLTKSSWCLQDTYKFLHLLQNHSILWENSMDSSDLPQQYALQAIAKEMKYPYDSIKKRWHILKQTHEQEKQKMLENTLYQPKYKWWPEAEELFEKMKHEKNTHISSESRENVLMESMFLPERQQLESSDDEEYENRFLQNPIPSVAPMSNMNEAMKSLFHNNNDDEDISQESNTNSSFPKENDDSSSSKFIWPGLEDDLLEGKWSLKHSVKFLRLYGVHRCLWDLNDPDYRSRPLRNAAIEDIAACMGHGLTASYVAKKIKIFRITYMQQRKRLLEANEKGEKPEILLKWFPLADSFLRPHIGLRSIKSDAKEMPQFDYQYVYANLNLIDPALLTDFRGKGTQNEIQIGSYTSDTMDVNEN